MKLTSKRFNNSDDIFDNSQVMDKVYEFAIEIPYRAFVNDRTIYIIGVIDNVMSLVVNRMLDKFIAENDTDLPVTIKINSPGGDLIPCLAIMSKIESAKESGLSVIADAEGMVASAAFFIYIVASQRRSLRYSRFLLHQPSMVDMSLNSSERMNRISKDINDIWLRIRDIVKANTDITDSMLDEITSTELDRYFWVEEALKYNIVDEVI